MTGAAEWHINADEPDVLDYDTTFKPRRRTRCTSRTRTARPTTTRVIVGLDLTAGPFAGFFQPIGGLPTLNTVNAGQTVPVQFSLSGAQGLGVIAGGFPRSAAIACDSRALVTGADPTSTPGKSTLSYDATTDTYTYPWRTDKNWAGTCRQLVVKLADGTFHHANFRFT